MLKQHVNISFINLIDNEEKENINKRSYTSFGKLILATEKSKPIYSIGNANRFNYSTGFRTPSPDTYSPPDVQNYKYKTSTKWKIGTGRRPPLSSNEKYEYYNHRYSPKDDLGTLPKQWNRTIGGSIGCAPKFKYDFREKTPGPGRYAPSLRFVRPKTPSYYVGEKTKGSSIKLSTGTNFNVGPGKYAVGTADKTLSKWTNSPIYSVGKGKRRGLYNKYWQKNETYYMYSSVGEQIMTKKRTEPRPKEGRSTRAIEQKRGVFRSMMERQPMRVSIPMPQF